MTDFLPLFPLKLVVFPGENLNLHVFEPRYKQLIRECDQNGITFGIPAFINNKVSTFGTELRLEEITKVGDNGELDIKTKGVGTYKIEEFYSVAPNKLYAGADIERLKNTSDGDILLYDNILKKVIELFRLLKIDKPIPSSPTSFSTFDIAHHVGFSLEQEYQLLTIPSEKKRQIFMDKHLESLIPIVRKMELLKKKAQMNGHFKNVIPPNF